MAALMASVGQTTVASVALEVAAVAVRQGVSTLGALAEPVAIIAPTVRLLAPVARAAVPTAPVARAAVPTVPVARAALLRVVRVRLRRHSRRSWVSTTSIANCR